MKSSPVLPFLSLLLVAFAACTAPPQERTVDSAAVEQADLDALQKAANDLLSAVNNDDLNAFLDGVTDDVVLMPPERPTLAGKEMIRAQVAEEFGKRASDEDWFEDEFVVAGDWGFVRGNYAAIFETESGETEERSGKQLLVFKRAEDGTWKLARAIWNVTVRVTEVEETIGTIE